MTSTPATLFGFRRALAIAPASRFRALHNLFHGTHHEANTLKLRHASAMSNAILRNMSTTLGEPSQLVDPATSFAEAHRRYSFITVLAIMSLFILITISIVALLLGFCRKNNSVFSLRGGGQEKAATPVSNTASQFELDDLEMDLADVETKVCPEDPSGACYYHLSDDDDDDDDYEDDMYDSDEDYVQVNGSTDRRSKYCANGKGKRKQRSRRTRKKRKLRFKDSRYYYHLHRDDDSDDDDDYDFDQRGWTDLEGDNVNRDESQTELRAPKRSTTFPQLQNVLTSCIKGDNSLPAQMGYQKLPRNVSVGHPDMSPETNNSKNISKSNLHDDTHNNFRKRTEHVVSALKCVQHTDKQMQNVKNSTSIQLPEQNSKDSPALLHPESTQLILVNRCTTRPSVLVQKRRLGPSAYIPPTAGRGRLVKAYSFHDIPRSRTKKQMRHRHFQTLKKLEAPAKPMAHHVTFKVGVVGGDTDIRVHHPNTPSDNRDNSWLK